MTSSYLLVVAFSIATALPTSFSTSSLRCPEELFVEEGSIQVVNCSLTTSTLTDLYWYIGASTSSFPIAQLVSGVKYVWSVQHYDISDDGSLIIKSAGRNQTGPYTILHFMEDYESERDTVFITLIGRRCKRNMKNEDEDGDLKEIDPLIDRFLKTQLQIETPKGERKQMSAASFFDSDVEWKNTKRILFVGDFLTEDSPIVKQANSKCYQENFDETLFIVDIKKLNFEANFANELHKQLPPNSKYSLEKINDILSLEKCWLILDGGGEPLELTKSPDSEEDIDVDKFTTFDLLYNYGSDLLRVWVTSIPSYPRNNFSDYTKIYLPKSNENESHSSITNL